MIKVGLYAIGTSMTLESNKSHLTLQRYLTRYLVKAPFPVREIGTVMTLLHAGHVP
jgi:hypothetical protein